MDYNTMASKVNREVCQLQVNGCLLNTSVLFHCQGKKEVIADVVLCSYLLFRGQQRSGFDKTAFISIYKASV